MGDRPGRFCSPRHKIHLQFNSRNEGLLHVRLDDVAGYMMVCPPPTTSRGVQRVAAVSRFCVSRQMAAASMRGTGPPGARTPPPPNPIAPAAAPAAAAADAVAPPAEGSGAS